ncbi:MAG: hypothetical protein JOZ18_15615 [Chloroflexi bacterium]|nr:hypothetical protein [Chloroflexota bacterium]
MFPRFSKRLRAFPKLALLINRNYTLWWLGSAISQIGDTLFTMMLILWVGTLLQGVVVHLLTGELNATNLLHIGAGVLIFVGGLHASRQFRKLQ